MNRDALAHLVVEGLRRRDVGPGRRQCGDQTLGMRALARARTADDEGQACRLRQSWSAGFPTSRGTAAGISPAAAPSTTQNTRLVIVTATTNWWCRPSGIAVSKLAGCGAPTICGATISATPMAANSGDRRKAISARPAAVATHRRRPPDLPREEVGGGHGRQFGRQAEARRQREHGKAGETPEQALAPAADAAGEFGDGDQDQRKADAA